MRDIILESIDSIREKVNGYVKEYFGEEKCLFDPIIRKEDDKYYLGYMIVDFVDETKEDYRMKRPNKWILVDIVSGELYKICDSVNNDYTNMPIDKVFDNNGSSKLFDSSNYMLTSFLEWKSKVIKELEDKFENDFSDMKVLKSKNDMISPSGFVLSNVDSLLEDMHDEMMIKLGGKIQELYKDYYTYLIDSVRKECVESGAINKEMVSNYIELLKYLWPDFKDIIDAFDNILRA